MTKRVRRTKAGAANAPSSEPTRFDRDVAGEFEGLPHVLTVDAVKSGEMPALGSSGLPASLEPHVPPDFRFWLAPDLEKARETRDALVDAAVFVDAAIGKVDGEHRLLVHRSFIAPVFAAKETGELAARTSALVQAASTLVLLADRPVAALKGDVADLADLGPDASWLLELGASPETSTSVAAKLATDSTLRAFSLATRPESVFVTNVAARKASPHVVPFVPPEATTKRDIRLIAKATDGAVDPVVEEERFVLGIVLEPDVIDSQSDTYDAATIRAAAHGYMQYYRNVGLQHAAYVTGKIEVLESYLAPVNMVVEGQTIKAGTWLMGLRFVDPALWAQVKSGALTGLSIGGTAIREPEPNVGELAPA